MTLGDWAGVGTIFVMTAFIGVVVWAYSGKRKKDFDEAAQLPFADDVQNQPKNSEEQK